MLVVCSWCQRQGLPTFLREVEPYSDTRLSHGICALHAEAWRAQLRARAQAEQRQAQGETGS